MAAAATPPFILTTTTASADDGPKLSGASGASEASAAALFGPLSRRRHPHQPPRPSPDASLGEWTRWSGMLAAAGWPGQAVCVRVVASFNGLSVSVKSLVPRAPPRPAVTLESVLRPPLTPERRPPARIKKWTSPMKLGRNSPPAEETRPRPPRGKHSPGAVRPSLCVLQSVYPNTALISKANKADRERRSQFAEVVRQPYLSDGSRGWPSPSPHWEPVVNENRSIGGDKGSGGQNKVKRPEEECEICSQLFLRPPLPPRKVQNFDS